MQAYAVVDPIVNLFTSQVDAANNVYDTEWTSFLYFDVRSVIIRWEDKTCSSFQQKEDPVHVFSFWENVLVLFEWVRFKHRA